MAKECEESLKKISDGFKKCRNAFTAIGDNSRQLIILTLLESDFTGIRVGEIAKKVHLTRPSVSHHLQILKESGIIAMRREGTKNYYYLREDETEWAEIVNLINLVYESITNNASSV